MDEQTPTRSYASVKTFVGANYDRIIVTMLAVPLTVYLALDYASLSKSNVREPFASLSEVFSKLAPVLGVAGLGPGTMLRITHGNATKENATVPPLLELSDGKAAQRVFCSLNESERWIQLTLVECLLEIL